MTLHLCLVIHEEESLVLLYGAAYRSAELIQVELFFGGGEKTARIEFGIAEELKQGPVQSVRPGFGRHQHGRTRSCAVFRRVVVGQNFEFLDGVNRRHNSQATGG